MAIEGITVYLVERTNGQLELEVPANPRFVSQLKHDIPSNLREWKPKIACTDDNHHACSGRWIIDRSQKVRVIGLLRMFYNNVTHTSPAGKANFRRTVI